MRTTPVLGPIITLFDTYPRLSAWVVLSIGIVGLLVYEARDVGLTTGNWIALVVASIVVSGLCVWIVSWEDEEIIEETPVRVKSTSTSESGAVVYEDVSPTNDKPA